MFTKEDIEKLLSDKYTLIRPPRRIYILKAPIIYPEMKARILGLNPAFERETIILSSDANEETLIHETIHSTLHLGEILTGPLARRVVKFRERFKPILKRKVVYEEKRIPSREVERYSLRPIPPDEGEVVLLELKEKRRFLWKKI